ncbi:MAG: hypothetical protein AB7Q27_11675 [Acidimicrobiia bacterium]
MRDSYSTPDDDAEYDFWGRGWLWNTSDENLNEPTPFNLRWVRAELDEYLPLHPNERVLLDLSGGRARRKTRGQAMLRRLSLPDEAGPFSQLLASKHARALAETRGDKNFRRANANQWLSFAASSPEHCVWAMCELGWSTELDMPTIGPRHRDRIEEAIRSLYAQHLAPYVFHLIDELDEQGWFSSVPLSAIIEPMKRDDDDE